MKRRIISGVVAMVLVFASLLLPTNFTNALSSGGSGGSFSDQLNLSYRSGNRLSSKYHIFAADLPQNQPLGLVLQFHGDGAYEFNNPSSGYSLGSDTGIVEQARQRNMITVPVLAPDYWGDVTWWEQGRDNAYYVKDLLRHLTRRYNIDLNRIWLVGYSGGAQFITQFFLPMYSSYIQGGGAVIFGGGGVPYGGTGVKPFSSTLRANFPMHWYTGNDDDGRGGTYNALNHEVHGAKAGKAWYESKGFTVSSEWPLGVGHDLGGQFGKITAQQLTLHDTGFSGTVDPIEPEIVSHTVTPTRNGVTLDVASRDIGRLTFRVSGSPFGTQTGWYLYAFPEGDGSSNQLSISSSLSPDKTYYYQIEEGLQRDVVTSGTFRTLP